MAAVSAPALARDAGRGGFGRFQGRRLGGGRRGGVADDGADLLVPGAEGVEYFRVVDDGQRLAVAAGVHGDLRLGAAVRCVLAGVRGGGGVLPGRAGLRAEDFGVGGDVVVDPCPFRPRGLHDLGDVPARFVGDARVSGHHLLDLLDELRFAWRGQDQAGAGGFGALQLPFGFGGVAAAGGPDRAGQVLADRPLMVRAVQQVRDEVGQTALPAGDAAGRGEDVTLVDAGPLIHPLPVCVQPDDRPSGRPGLPPGEYVAAAVFPADRGRARGDLAGFLAGEGRSRLGKRDEDPAGHAGDVDFQAAGPGQLPGLGERDGIAGLEERLRAGMERLLLAAPPLGPFPGGGDRQVTGRGPRRRGGDHAADGIPAGGGAVHVESPALLCRHLRGVPRCRPDRGYGSIRVIARTGALAGQRGTGCWGGSARDGAFIRVAAAGRKGNDCPVRASFGPQHGDEPADPEGEPDKPLCIAVGAAVELKCPGDGVREADVIGQRRLTGGLGDLDAGCLGRSSGRADRLGDPPGRVPRLPRAGGIMARCLFRRAVLIICGRQARFGCRLPGGGAGAVRLAGLGPGGGQVWRYLSGCGPDWPVLP